MRLSNISLLVLALWLPIESHAQKLPPFELKHGDRVAFIGDTLMEREQYHGWIELMLTTRFPDRQVTFRNLGWSADTPGGESRLGLSLKQAGVEPAGEAWKLLQQQIEETKPTVVFLGYGMASSFDGEAGLPQFKSEYIRLLDFIERTSPGARVLLLSPLRHQKMPAPWPNPSRHNDQLKAYGKAVAEIAATRKISYISLLEDSALNKGAEISDNGIHLNSEGYRRAAVAIEAGLGWKAGRWVAAREAEALRQVILRKNEFYFHRSRPANMAYIFGFRKGEQGRNAVEMPRFDPLITLEEQKIAKLRSLTVANPGNDLQPAPLRQGSIAAKFTPQPAPEFQVGEGLEVTLWAENPLLHKPIQINFDAQGRLWVASSEIYPQIEPGQAASDKIVVLEDTTGSGRADKATVFADGLLIPTGVIPGDGGAYVAQSTELLHFKDTDGDGRADQRRIVLGGFGTEDVHHNLHTLVWGQDGRLWMNQSIYTRTETETPNGVVRLRSGGIMALRPDNLQMEIIFRGWVNAWGHQFDQFGQSFVTDGAGFMGINWGVSGAMYFTYAKARRTLESVSPGNYPKFASIEIVYSRQFPDDWQGSFITCDFRANRVTRFSLQEQGAGYVTKQEPDLMRTSASTFRPIDVKLGPDGALYIADWSNPIIQHGEVDFRDPRRDKEHGRIWRVAAKNRPTNPQPKLVGAKNSELLDQLLSANSFDRSQARRVMLEKGGSTLAKDLAAWTKKQSAEPALLQALWMHEGINQPNTKLLTRLLSAKEPRIRASAVRVLANWIDRVSNASELLAARVNDSFPRVRLEAVRALAKIPTAKSVDLILSVLNQPMDPYLDYAVWLSINDL
ncbi:MAG: HEAT repeat domain-containing protein, partial [Opitutaceae bacterium]|nr:HEAT repeat domain-containing protein [Verrucomicrobiales bacterium]